MEFRGNFAVEVSKLCTSEPITLAKQQLYGCLLEVLREQSVGGELEAMSKLAEEAWSESDPWVNFEKKKYRYSRFMMLKRKPCYIVKMPETEEYLAMDVEKLQNGFDKMKIPLKVKDLPSIDENDERIVSFSHLILIFVARPKIQIPKFF
ncbi:hypothetical protein CAEBREN_02373 [Caenorhabditis brenneri]|uniref:Uncharacterized protein n=1 Tax=Caenorhabditis brenneri TaxID=135651 RepID=G0N2W6_CAEBE|nr:hypothetical protein CAEBREN_02373 [Caenorhabditis brenneri]